MAQSRADLEAKLDLTNTLADAALLGQALITQDALEKGVGGG